MLRLTDCLLPLDHTESALKKYVIQRLAIAEQDLILRGGGEILGTKQSGEPVFFFADLARDLKILLQADNLAKSLKNSCFIDFQIDLFAKNKRKLIKSG
jgi:RecG-like helicase